MFKKFLPLSLSFVVIVPAILNLVTGKVIAEQVEASMNEDALETVNGLRWGAPGWPYSKVVVIKDSLVSNVLGKVVLDRHGVDRSGGESIGDGNNTNSLIGSIGNIVKVSRPFSSPAPLKYVLVSLWGSKIDGCFAELIIQYAPSANNSDLQEIGKALVPKVLEVGVNGQIVQLTPQPNSKEKAFSQNYTYTENSNNTKIEHSGTWYMARNLFRIDSNIANVLSNAPAQKVQARITLGTDQSILFPIGEKTVKRWKDAYSFNPRCTNMNKAQATSEQPQPASASVSAPDPSTSKPSRNQHNSSKPSRKAATNPRVVGSVGLAATQTLNNVVIKFNGAHVQNNGSFTANLIIQNNSDRAFGFLPVSATVEGATGQTVPARLTLKSTQSAVVPPRGEIEGQVAVLGQRWKNSDSQDLTLVIREGTTGGRTFRIPF